MYSSHSTNSLAVNEAVPDCPSSNSNISKRKRDRDIEQALASGNLDIIDQNNLIKSNIIAVEGVGSWDSSKYESQKQKEYDVLKKYNLVGGTDGTVNQPSKQQNRKHHISSLAFNAAKAELALLDSKATRNKTKYETQSKYGW